MQSWKHFQQNLKVKFWLGKLKIVVVAVLVVVILVRLYLVGEWIINAPSQASLRMSGISWNGDEQLNFFVNPNWVVGFDVVERELDYFLLDELDSIDQLPLTLKKLKVYLDGYLMLPEDLESLDELPSQILTSLFTNQLRTNLTRWQVLKLWWGLRSDYRGGVAEALSLPENQVIDESLRVTVLNGTNIAGLAQESTIWIENIGAKVINVSNADHRADQTRIEVFLAEDQYRTVMRIEQIFGEEARFVPIDQPMREDIRVTVGRDFLQ